MKKYVLKQRVTYYARGEFYLNKRGESCRELSQAKRFKSEKDARAFLVKNKPWEYSSFFVKAVL